MDTPTIIAIVQAILVGGFVLSYVGVKMFSLYERWEVLWAIAGTVVIYLPLALAWFGVMAAMFFENGNLMIGVVVGLCAIIVNYLIDYLIFKSNFPLFARIKNFGT